MLNGKRSTDTPMPCSTPRLWFTNPRRWCTTQRRMERTAHPMTHCQPPLKLFRAAAAAGWRVMRVCLLVHCPIVCALERTDTVFKVFQFPADKIPSIDGLTTDWDCVPASYAIGSDQLVEDFGRFAHPDPKNLNVRVRVGWVKGLNRLYVCPDRLQPSRGAG